MWRPDITEIQALYTVLSAIPPDERDLVSGISLNQAPRVGAKRIEWLDHAPNGDYPVNQHLYGEGGALKSMTPAGALDQRSAPLVYDPDMLRPGETFDTMHLSQIGENYTH